MAAISAAVMAASATAYGVEFTKRARLEEERKLQLAMMESEAKPYIKASVRTTSDCKCPACGSFEYETIGRRSFCSYCRTPKIG